MLNRYFKLMTIVSVLVVSYTATAAEPKQSTVISSESINWGYLNPLRGDKSPGAANLWGDRTKDTATGMLVKFNKGFSSPPHIHNITYRGIVIQGLMHNADPAAKPMWLPTASYWTQPAGEDHITAANGGTNLIYLEIDSGPYLVKPSEQQFDNGERPINLHASNLVCLKQDESSLIEGDNIEVSHLWKKDKLQGYLLKFPENSNTRIESDASEFRAVVIKGSVDYESTETTQSKFLRPGSYFSTGSSSAESFTHNISSHGEVILYIRSNEPFKAHTSIEAG